jgi:site-specific recombinase XerD
MSGPNDADGPPEHTPREAVERWLDKRRIELRDQTAKSLKYRLKLFADWCEENDIETLHDLDGWNIDTYETERRSTATQITLSKELGTLKNFLEWAEGVGLAPDGIAAVVEPPKMPDDPSSDVMLAPADAQKLIRHYRNSDERASRCHALLELAWFTGARVGGIRSLDVRDFNADAEYVYFRHRPETGTVLKKGVDGERAVALSTSVCEVIDEYISEHRLDVHDDEGRQPLIASRVGRPTCGTIGAWMNYATAPCRHSLCPHDKKQATCNWFGYTYGSKCPSTRSPHQVRTGAITWMRNRGIPREVVKERVNASERTIEKHYDKVDPVAEMEERRREYASQFELESSERGGDK